MTEAEINHLTELNKTRQLAWIPDEEKCRLITRIDGPVAYLSGSNFIRLDQTDSDKIQLLEKVNYPREKTARKMTPKSQKQPKVQELQPKEIKWSPRRQEPPTYQKDDVVYSGNMNSRENWIILEIDPAKGSAKLEKLKWSTDMVNEPGVMFLTGETLKAKAVGTYLHKKDKGSFYHYNDPVTIRSNPPPK